MRWADELIIPLPSQETQLALVSADEQLASFQAALGSLRASIDQTTWQNATANRMLYTSGNHSAAVGRRH